MARLCLSLIAAALLAGPALAQDDAIQDPATEAPVQDGPPAGTDWKALLIATIEANGCAMTEEEAAEKLPPLGFVQEWTGDLVGEMLAEGTAALDETSWSLIVKTEKCK